MSTPARSACAPAWCERLSTSWYIVLTRRVGLPDAVPNAATPAMVTAGPVGSVGGASRSLCAICARVSLTVFDDNVQVLPNASEWSPLASPVDALGALSAPTPREFADVT